MFNSPFRWESPTKNSGSPIGKGSKTKAKVNNILGRKSTIKKFITGGK